MKKIYKILDKPNGSGAWYESFGVPDNFPVENDFIEIAPPANIRFPRFIYGRGWVEDKDQLITVLSTENKQNKQDLLDLMEYVSSLEVQ